MDNIRRYRHAFRGASRNERAPSVLLPSNIHIDARETWQWLSFLSRAASLINYFDENNEITDTWDSFLVSDPSVILARILEVRPEVVDTEIRMLVTRLHESTSDEYRIGLFESIVLKIAGVIEVLNDWYVQSTRVNHFGSQSVVTETLGNIIASSLAVEFYRFRNEINIFRVTALLSNSQVDRILQSVHAVWLYEGNERPREVLSTDPGQLLLESEPVIMRAYQQFYLALVYMSEKAVLWFGESLEENNRHAPHIGMLLAFIKLMDHARAQMNELPLKHITHYYEEILKQKARQVVPDRAILCLRTADHINEVSLEQGTEFSSGVNQSGTSSVYISKESLILNSMAAESFRTVFISKNRKLMTNSSYRIVTGIYSAPVSNSGDGHGRPFSLDETSWPVLGEEQLDKDESGRNMSDSETGFIISSPILLMKEGRRDITVTYRISEKSMGLLLFLLDDVAANLSMTRPQAAAKMFMDAFILSCTGENGWIPLTRWSLSDADQWELQGGFSFRITLTEEDPAITGSKRHIHGFPDDTGWPLFKTLLNPDSDYYLYTFCQILDVLSVQIDVNVTGLKSLTFYNQTGLLDGSLPFQPFGSIPAKNTYLMIGSAELFVKRLTALNFLFKWNNLPELEGGFSAYFREYNMDLNNDSFEVRLSALSNGSFNPQDSLLQPAFRLFESENQQGRLSNVTTFQVQELQSLQVSPDYRMKNLPGYSNDVRSGYFRFMLDKPAFGFGHSDYNRLFSASMMSQKPPGFFSRLFGIGKTRPPSIPREPFVPVLNSVSADYSARTILNLTSSRSGENDTGANEKIYTLYPFGYREVFAAGRSESGYLFPDFEHDAYLYMGLKEVLPGRLVSMFLDIREGRLGQNYRDLELSWSYLRKNNWEAMPEGMIQSDSTRNFSTSGIIRFVIPHDIEKGNTIMPADLYWIRVAAKGDLSIAGRINTIGFNAIEVEWEINEDIHHFAFLSSQPPVSGLSRGIPEIQDVKQMTPYYGGREKESVHEYLTRVSERLRHKNRGINSWDIERLLIQEFDFLRRVKCFTQMEYPQLESGHIRIVVIPEVKAGETEPVAAFHQIRKMEDYLMAKISPFLRPEIINPVYDKLKITCSLTLKKEYDTDKGKYLQQLHRDILYFLCPWLIKDSADAFIQFGGMISRNDVLTFIRERVYVAKVTRFSLRRISGNPDEGYSLQDTALQQQKDGVLMASTPWSVFSPVDQHDIEILANESYIAAEPAAIDGMRLGTDFVILGDENNQPASEPENQETDSDEWFINPKV